jgi:hypothetical protein
VVVTTGDVVVTLALAELEPVLVFEATLTAQPDRATAARTMVDRKARTAFRLARSGALG